MSGAVRYRLAFVVESDGVFRVTCPEIAEVVGIGSTEQEALDQARHAAIAQLRTAMAVGHSVPDGAFQRFESRATLETELGNLVEAVHPGEGRKVCIEEVWVESASAPVSPTK